MPVVPPVLSTSVFTQLTAQSIKGRDAINLASIIGTAVSQYLSIPNKLTILMSGVAGPVGTVTSVAAIGLAPPAMAGLMLQKASLPPISLKGRDVCRMFSAISLKICLSLQTMLVNGSAMGIATGAGVGSFTGVSPIGLSNFIYNNVLTKRFTGRDVKKLADSIAYGVAQHLITTVKVSVTCLGVPAPIPPAGPVPVLGIPATYNKIF